MGDGLKGIGKVVKFIGSNLDNIPMVVNAFEFMAKNFSDEVIQKLAGMEIMKTALAKFSLGDNLKIDSHLTYYVEGEKQFHVYFGDKVASYNGEKVAELDLDDTSGYGPETVTITLKTSFIENGVFKYSVHNFSNGSSTTSSALSLSGAMVRVYIENNLSKTFYVPQNNVGTVWHVFDIDKNGIMAVNDFYSSNASGGAIGMKKIGAIINIIIILLLLCACGNESANKIYEWFEESSIIN